MTRARGRFSCRNLPSRDCFYEAFVSHRLRFAILLVFTLLISPALAQPGAKPASPQPVTSDTLTPEQAKRALETLQDDKKRGEIINTLRAIAKASPQAAAQPVAAEPVPEQHSPIPLTADSLGAQLLLMVSEQVGEMSREVADVARTLTNFPSFYYWFLRTANDPAAYGLLIDIAWKLALVFGCALLVEWVVFRLIKRPVAFLEQRLPQTARVPAQALASADPPSSVADVTPEPELHRRRLSLARAWQSVIRLPFVLGRLVLELLPVVVFVSVATALLGIPTLLLIVLQWGREHRERSNGAPPASAAQK